MKKNIIIGAAFFCFGIAAAVAARLIPWAEDHSRHHHGVETAAALNLLHQPLKDLSGMPASLADAGEERLVVNFWATWCAPCLKEMPLLQQARQHKIKTIGISYEEIAIIKEFTRRHPVEYPLYKSDFNIFYFLQQQGNRAAVLPYTVLIDRHGKVIDEKTGDFKTVEEIIMFARQESVRS